MKDDQILTEIAKTVADDSRQAFINIWFRTYWADGFPTMSCFIQPEAKPKTVTNLSFSTEASISLGKLLEAKIQADLVNGPIKYSSMTVQIVPSGAVSVDYGFDDLNKVAISDVSAEFRSRVLSHLRFIPPKL